MKKSLWFSILLVLLSNLTAQTHLASWEKGFLDIHQISTGRGNACFCVLPDGTTLLIDVGDFSSADSLRRSTIVPDNRKSPARWVADYIHEFHPAGKKAQIDYVLLTHFHDDHIGHFYAVSIHPQGQYKLSGITELGTLLPIRILIDRGSPEAKDKPGEEPAVRQLFAKYLEDYDRFIDYQTKTNKLQHQKFTVGACKQIKLLHQPSAFPDFTIKNLFANGEISSNWDSTIVIRKFKQGDQPDENDLSLGIRISYGAFDYYTGGDISGVDGLGTADPASMESLAAPVIGSVDVAVLNHHGDRDSQNEFFVRTIRPRVWIQPSWSAGHPGPEVLRRIMSKELYPGERDLFTNFLHPAVERVLGKRWVDQYKSTTGHMVIRVEPHGAKYAVYVLQDASEDRKIVAQYTYRSR